MAKLILFLLLAYVAYRVFRPRKSALGEKPVAELDEKMLLCAQCGVHFPRGEAILDEDRVFCCEPHRAAWKQSH